MTTPNKLQVKPDLSRVDENQKDWSMQDLIDAIHKWLRRNSTETGADQPETLVYTTGREFKVTNAFFLGGGGGGGDKQDHCSENCTPPRGPCITALEDRRKFFINS